MEIKRLDWDSNFFGYEIGKISIESGYFDFKDVLSAKDDFKLIFVESGAPIDKKEFGPCYTKIKYSKEIEWDNNVEERRDNLTVKQYSGNLTDQLLSLAYQSGINSRFRLDENFVNSEFERLYKKWIENSLSGKIADTVEVVKDESSNVLGFVTISFKKNISKIGLIAVDNSARGLGLGSLLLNKVCELSTSRSCEKIIVSTQKDNKLACKFYEKNGFREYELKYIYHWWTDK